MASFRPEEAELILEHLVNSGIVKMPDIHDARQALRAEVEALTGRLHDLATVRGLPASVARSESGPRSSAIGTARPRETDAAQARPGRPSRVISPEGKKSLQLHGRYMGLMRGIPKSEQAKLKALIPKLGKQEVVNRMEVMVHGSRK